MNFPDKQVAKPCDVVALEAGDAAVDDAEDAEAECATSCGK